MSLLTGHRPVEAQKRISEDMISRDYIEQKNPQPSNALDKFDDLDKRIADLIETLSVLVSKINPILREETPSPICEKDAKNSHNNISGLTRRIKNTTDTIQALIYNVAEISSRVNL